MISVYILDNVLGVEGQSAPFLKQKTKQLFPWTNHYLRRPNLRWPNASGVP